MILRFIFVLLVVPFLRTWPRLFVWAEQLYQNLQQDRDEDGQ